VKGTVNIATSGKRTKYMKKILYMGIVVFTFQVNM